MIIPVAALVALLLPLALGGRLSRLADLHLRHLPVIGLALGVQIVIVMLVSGHDRILAAVHIGTYALAAWFVWANRAVTGLPVIGLGAALNAVTIAVNGGTLPARPGALRAAGIDPQAEGFVNSGALEDPRLWWFGDVFAVPQPLPLANVFSVGDVLIVLGVGIVAWTTLGTRWTAPRPATTARGAAPGRRSASPTTP